MGNACCSSNNYLISDIDEEQELRKQELALVSSKVNFRHVEQELAELANVPSEEQEDILLKIIDKYELNKVRLFILSPAFRGLYSEVSLLKVRCLLFLLCTSKKTAIEDDNQMKLIDDRCLFIFEQVNKGFNTIYCPINVEDPLLIELMDVIVYLATEVLVEKHIKTLGKNSKLNELINNRSPIVCYLIEMISNESGNLIELDDLNENFLKISHFLHAGYIREISVLFLEGSLPPKSKSRRQTREMVKSQTSFREI